MQKLVIDTLGMLDDCGESLEALDFYKDGTRGLIADYLNYYLDKDPQERLLEDGDIEFFDKVLTQYQNSLQYQINNDNPFGCLGDTVVMILCYRVAHATRQMVAENQTELRQSVVEPHRIDLGTGYVAISMRS